MAGVLKRSRTFLESTSVPDVAAYSDMSGHGAASYRRKRRAAGMFGPARRRRSTMKKAAPSEVSRLSGLGLGSTQIINRRHAPIFRVCRTVTAESGGLTFTGTNAPISGGMRFDPLGGQSDSAGWGSGTGFDFQIPDAASFGLIFDQYRCTRIDVNIRAQNSKTATSNVLDLHPCTFYGRYNYDKQLTGSGTVTAAQMSDLENVKVHQFTPTNPQCTWSIIPMEEGVVQTTGVLAQQGVNPQPMAWSDLNIPIPLYGFCFRSPNLASLAAGNEIQLSMDVTFHLEFKYSA